MDIRQKLALLFTLITAAILSIFAYIIYYGASNNREKEFYELIKKEGITKANLFFDAQLDEKVLQEIYLRNREVINEVEVAIYDKDFNLMYHDAVEIDYVKETPEMIQDILREGEYAFYQDDWQVLGTVFEFNDEKYAVVSAAYDSYGFSKLNHLRTNIFIVLILSVFIIYLAGLFFAKKALLPINNIVDKAKKITAYNLDQRLETITSKDEIAELSKTFNEMLDRLEQSFDAQKEFVYNISHEFRTPLTALTTELDLSLNKDRTSKEYKKAIETALNDAKKLNKISSGLLDLARANYDATKISFKTFRIDEIIIDAADYVQKSNSAYQTQISYDDDNIESEINVKGNEYLLKTAFINLIDNACKFSSDNSCKIEIQVTETTIIIRFLDRGVGIKEDEIEEVFKPFFRGANKGKVEGTGIGLSLTKRILDLHNAKIHVFSEEEKGTTVELTFTLELSNHES